jgi:hypothetical protein
MVFDIPYGKPPITHGGDMPFLSQAWNLLDIIEKYDMWVKK